MTLYMEGSGWKIKIDERSQSGGEEKDTTRRVYRLVLSLTCLRGEMESGYSSIQVILYNINVSKLWKIPKGFGKIINKF